MPLQWRNQIWQSLEESAEKRCSECALDRHPVIGLGDFPSLFLLYTFSFLPTTVERVGRQGFGGGGGVWAEWTGNCSTHTPSITFRHIPPNSARFSYATEGALHTPCIAFRHLPPNSARFSYATEGAVYLCAAVHRRGQRPPKGSGINMTVEAT